MPVEKQERYARNKSCEWWPIFEGLNDWTIVTFEAGTDADEDNIEETQKVVLGGLATMMSENVKVDGIRVFMTDDE
jgi:hypothetical protein